MNLERMQNAKNGCTNKNTFSECEDKNLSFVVLHCTFTFGFFSHNFAISVKDKGLTNVKMYVERKAFSKGKI